MSDASKGPCKGICVKYKATKPAGGLGRYASGQVRCQVCDIFLTREGCHDKDGKPVNEDSMGLYCNCCNYKVTSRPRSKFYNEQLKNYREMKTQVEKEVDSERGDAPLDFDEMKIFLTETIFTQANYQYVIIKSLLENNSRDTKDHLAEALEFYNKDKPPQDYKNSIVFSVLERRGIIAEELNGYRLNISKDYDSFEKLELISLCNLKIYQNKLRKNMQYYIALGPWENWNHTMENLPLRWGVADTTPSNIGVFDQLSVGDTVFFYSTKDEPTYFSERGFFGVGIVSKKDINKSEKYWPLEKKTDKSFYTHKIFLDPLKCVQSDEELISVSDGLPTVKGLNHITEGKPLNELLSNVKSKWMISLKPSDTDISTNYWKIAPGESAKYWDVQRRNAIIGIEWNELGDLSGRTFEEIHAELRRIWPSSIASVSPQFRDFLSIKEGDIVLANRGMKTVIGIGKITGPYKFRPDLPFNHTYPVEWIDITEHEIPSQGVVWRKTVYPVSFDLYNQIISGKFTENKLSNEFEELVKKFDLDRYCFTADWNTKYVSEGELKKTRDAFVSKFPADKIKDLKIDQYVQGTRDLNTGEKDKQNFSYLIEAQTEGFGSIWGSYAQKFGVFFKDDTNEYWYNKQKYDKVNEAFEEVKNQVYIILEAGKQFQKDEDWQKLSNIIDDGKNFDIFRNLRSLILAVYFPNTFLAIHSEKYIDQILDFFKVPKQRLRGLLTLKQAKILEIKNSHPIMKNWTTEDYSYFLWNAIVLGDKEEVEETKGDEPEEEYPEIKPLTLPTEEQLVEIRNEIKKTLLVEDRVIERIIASLYGGKHVLLTGPVGTGKTDLAQKIPKIVWNYFPEIHTATADWTTHDVIGGLFPKIENDQVKFKIQKGCVSSTISKNWLDGTGKGGIRKMYKYLNPETNKLEEYNGVWLVIDEFNRANIDKAFGQLFTALEYRNELKVPTEKSERDNQGESFERYLIPEDYRIIGTLNTYDKHFLFHLSDALKRRFDFIEINPPKREISETEISIVHQKAADNELLQTELQELLKSEEDIDRKLYEIMSIIRQTKQLGTAILISIFKDLLIYHKMGKSWNDSLDSALVKKIIPQLESLPISTLRILIRFVSGDIANFYIQFPIDEHFDKVDDYSKELESYRKYYFERVGKNFSKNWVDEFRKNNLSKLKKDLNRTPEQIEDYKKIIQELDPWNVEIKKPILPYFKKSLDDLIHEKEYTMINMLEPNLD